MDMYVQMYDEMEKQEDDNPTIGILLCSDTDEDVTRYSSLQYAVFTFLLFYLYFLLLFGLISKDWDQCEENNG